jgi:hypothetical protein
MKGISFFLHRELKWASLSPKKAEKYSLENMQFSAKLTLPALAVFCSLGPKLSCNHVFQFVAPGAYVAILKPEKCIKIFLLTLHICLELIFKTGSHQDFWISRPKFTTNFTLIFHSMTGISCLLTLRAKLGILKPKKVWKL